MDKQRISYLLQAYQEQTATPEERMEFAEMLHSKQYETTFHELLDQNWSEITSEEINQLEMPNYDQVLHEIKRQPRSTRQQKTWWPRLAIAAAAILVISALGLYFYQAGSESANTEFTTATDLPPGKNGATLTLGDGKKILVSDIMAGNIASEGGVKITKTENGELIYEVIGSENTPLSYNTLSTSNGQQTKVRLQDGTMVYLNAGSSINYPSSFANLPNRRISLTGEAYFEVAKDKQHPFIVVANHQSIEVLGTTFNISSYINDASVKTTLLEGSVRIINTNTNSSATLKPGEQAILGENTLSTKAVRVDDEVAWKNGYFMFNNESLGNIMKKVARWYDVEISYEDELIKQKTFFGSVSRLGNVSEILKLLQKTGRVTFEIKDRRIIVSEKK